MGSHVSTCSIHHGNRTSRAHLKWCMSYYGEIIKHVMKIIPVLGVEDCLCTEIHVHTLMFLDLLLSLKMVILVKFRKVRSLFQVRCCRHRGIHVHEPHRDETMKCDFILYVMTLKAIG